MQHTEFKIIGLLVLERKILKRFYHIWASRPSWLFDHGDQVHFYKIMFPLPQKAPHKFVFDWPSGPREEDFEHNGHIHSYSRGAGAGQLFFKNINLLSVWSFVDLESPMLHAKFQEHM